MNFILVSLISIVTIFITWLIMYEILGKVWNLLPKLHIRPRLKVMLIGIPIFTAHIMSIWVYALVYFLVENFTNLGKIVGQGRVYGLNFESFLDCLHFSSTTYTSLGLGDFLPTHDLRMLLAAEVLNGLVMIGWTVSFTFLTMEKFWSTPRSHNIKIDEK